MFTITYSFKLHLRPPGTELRSNGMRLGGCQLVNLRKSSWVTFCIISGKRRLRLSRTTKRTGETHGRGLNKGSILSSAIPTDGLVNHNNACAKVLYLEASSQAMTKREPELVFVTEGEASALTCLASCYAPHPLSVCPISLYNKVLAHPA